jgi:Mg-chelatase subunit ChlD
MSEEFSNLPPKEREARLTAFILGELSPAESDGIRQQLARDSELTREHARLQQTIELVRETSAMDRKTSANGTPRRLDDTRRQKLLEAFKQPVVTPVVAPRRPRDLRFLPLALAAALVGLLAVSVMLPSLAKSKARAPRTSVQFAQPTTADFAAEPEMQLASESVIGRVLKGTVREKARASDKRESELALTENFSVYAYDTEATKAAPAPKLPSVALALPAIADADGDVRELRQLADEFDGAGQAMKPMTESLARSDVNRGLARGNEVAFGNTRGFFDDNAPRAAAPSMPASQPVSNNRWDKNEVAGGGTITVAPQRPAANLGMLWAETGVGQRAVVSAGANEWQSSQATPASGGSVTSVDAAGYANVALAGQYFLIPTAPGVSPPPSVAPVQTADQAQSVIEGRRNQLQNSPVPARPSIPPTTPGDDLYVARDEKALAGRQTATHYAELAKEREVTSKKRALTEVENAWSDPVRAQSLPSNMSSGGGVGGFVGGVGGLGGRGGGNARAGLIGGAQSAPANEGMLFAGVNIQPGGQPSVDGRSITDLTAVQQKVDGLQDAPLAKAAAPLPARGRLANDQSGVPALGVEFESKSKGVEDRFSRADDFSVTPEMLDAVKLQIQNAQSYAGAAGVAAGKDNLSGNRPSLANTPNASSRNFTSGGLGFLTPTPNPAPPASGPATKEVAIQEFASAGYVVSANLNTNAVVNYFADVPATAGDNTFAWKFTGNDAWFGANALGDVDSLITGSLAAREEKMTGLKSDANGRVEIQLPARADGGLQFITATPTNSVAPIQGRFKADADTLAGRGFFRLQSTNAGAPVAFNPNVGTNVAPAKAEKPAAAEEPVLAKKVSATAPTPQPEVLTRDNTFSTFSLNVADVSFKLAAASLEKGAMPDVATMRSEEFINAFDYRDPVPAAGVPLAFVSERARYPFAHNRDVLRFSVKTAAQGRDGGKPLNIVLLLDNSGSMERADRVRIIQEALRALAAQLQPQDKLSVVTFSRTARLWADGVTGAQAAEVAKKIAELTPEGGTNVEEALDLAYRTALRHYAATAINRVVLLTDGAANLGNVEPAALKAKVESFRKQGVALDCFGIGWEGFNDDLLENLSRNGDGRYGFVNTPEEASTEFAAQLAGALQVAASDVKVQVEFNPKRVTAYRQIGYAKHQLTKQQFRDNTVDAAEISASEAGNALYVIETNPRGEGPIATVRARFRIPQTSDYREHEWVVPFGSAVELEQSSSALRLATSASAFSEWLAGSPFAGEVTTDRLLGLLSGVPEVYGADPRPKKLEWMIRQAKSISGK